MPGGVCAFRAYESLVVVVVEMAQITPPIGFNLFVLQGMTDHEMGFIARAAFPMFLIMVAPTSMVYEQRRV